MADRSPRYPNTDLKDAIEQAAKIFSADRQNPIERLVAAKHMGYSSLSGASDKAIAALQHYGLLEKTAKGEVAVTQLAMDILHPESIPDRAKAIAEAVVRPKVFSLIRDKYPDGHFSEESLRSFLIREGYADSAIPQITKIYHLNRQFAKLEMASESGGPSMKKGEESKLSTENALPVAKENRFGGAKPGDFVMWESGGSLQFIVPQRVRSVSDDGEWVFVDGSTTGIPMSQVTVETATPTVNPVLVKAPELPLPTEETRLGAGETEWMRNKVGTDTTVRILTKGDLGPREIGRLIKLLEAQKSVLEDDDEQ